MTDNIPNKEYIPNGKRVPMLSTICDEPIHNDLRELLTYSATTYKEMDAFIIKHQRKGEDPEYEHVSFIRLKEDVDDLGTALLDKGLKDAKIAVIGKNRYEWMLTYYAVMGGLGVCVPLDKDLPYEELESCLQRSGSTVLVFDPDKLPLVEELKKNATTDVALFIAMEPLEGYEDVPALIAHGRSLYQGGDTAYRELPIDRDALALLMFTSGTTDRSKVVMLSNYNITYNVYEVLSTESFVPGDVNIQFLPYHHTFGSTGQSMWIGRGVASVFCDGLKYVQKNMVEYGVSVFICVPLLIESMYKRIMAGVKKQGKEKTLARGIRISRLLLKVGIDVRRKLFKEILDQLGGNLRFIVSGASPLDPEVVKGFADIGVEVVQGYGLTETSPVLAGENHYNLRPGSIGHAMPGVELIVADPDEEGVGELMARCPSIMLGYYDDPEKTAEVMTGDWFHTGDLASVDEDGFLFIQGRDKNVIVLKNGKNVYPEELELLISSLPYVEENMVYGEPRRKDGDEKDLALVARIVYNKDTMETVYGASTEEEIEQVVKKDLEAINDGLPPYKYIHRHEITSEPMEKTTTGKVKRYKELAK